MSGCSSSTSDGHLLHLYGMLGNEGSYLEFLDGGGDGTGKNFVFVVVVIVGIIIVVFVVVVVVVMVVVMMVMVKIGYVGGKAGG